MHIAHRGPGGDASEVLEERFGLWSFIHEFRAPEIAAGARCAQGGDRVFFDAYPGTWDAPAADGAPPPWSATRVALVAMANWHPAVVLRTQKIHLSSVGTRSLATYYAVMTTARSPRQPVAGLMRPLCPCEIVAVVA
jgi:hypothetical protein